MNHKPDILIYLSDQHDGRSMGCAGHPLVHTPNLDVLAAEGTQFLQTYTPCPLCVPARMSMLTGRLPIHTGVYTNRGSIHPDMPTFLHALAIAGYETVLCGRMHFEGSDQRHGFTKRIAGDITQTAIGPSKDPWEDLGVMAPTLTEGGCLHVIGGGNSPTLEYDRYVTGKALEYLSTPHIKPLCMVVGTYGPHFPYIAPKELYDKYLPLTSLPPTLDLAPATADKSRTRDTSPEIIRGVQAAYLGMIEFQDELVGRINNAWNNYLNTNKREGIFIYTSDHGDHAGDRGFYGKQSLYEAALRIPMIFAGHGIPKNRQIETPVSLLDLSPTICQLADAKTLPLQDGRSLVPELSDKVSSSAAPDIPNKASSSAAPVISEWINLPYRKGTAYGRMIRKGPWKLISYYDYPEEDILSRPEEDPWELNNLVHAYPKTAKQLREEAHLNVDVKEIVKNKNLRDDDYSIIETFNQQQGTENPETWLPGDDSTILPDHYLTTENPMPDRFRKYWDKRKEE